jgi:hypothetical protein
MSVIEGSYFMRPSMADRRICPGSIIVRLQTMMNGPSSWARPRTTLFGLTKVSKSDTLVICRAIWANIREWHRYFMKFETFIPHKDHPNVDISERGSSGPMKSESASRPHRSASSSTCAFQPGTLGITPILHNNGSVLARRLEYLLSRMLTRQRVHWA